MGKGFDDDSGRLVGQGYVLNPNQSVHRISGLELAVNNAHV